MTLSTLWQKRRREAQQDPAGRATKESGKIVFTFRAMTFDEVRNTMADHFKKFFPPQMHAVIDDQNSVIGSLLNGLASADLDLWTQAELVYKTLKNGH